MYGKGAHVGGAYHEVSRLPDEATLWQPGMDLSRHMGTLAVLAWRLVWHAKQTSLPLQFAWSVCALLRLLKGWFECQ